MDIYRQGAGKLTDPVKAMRYLQRKKVDLVYKVPALVRVLDRFARYLYDMNIKEQEVQPQGGVKNYVTIRERSSIMSARLGGGGLSQNADTADAGEGGWWVSHKMLILLTLGSEGMGKSVCRAEIKRK